MRQGEIAAAFGVSGYSAVSSAVMERPFQEGVLNGTGVLDG